MKIENVKIDRKKVIKPKMKNKLDIKTLKNSGGLYFSPNSE